MIINPRGTSGSGKTTIVRGLMDKATNIRPIGGTVKKPYAYELSGFRRPLFIIGGYENVCGGCDGIPTQDAICHRVRKCAAEGDVIFEGLLISHLFGRYQALDRELTSNGHHYIWAFLDTPLELCLERVIARREASGRARGPFNPKNTTQKWHDMRRVFKKCEASKLDARWLSHETATEDVYKMLMEETP
jgi:adenylate kinase family enzyme